MADSFNKNFIDYEEYPHTVELHNRCVNMIARLYHAPTNAEDNALGTSTVGSSEAIMLATLAMKKRWQKKRKAEGKDYSNPNLIMSSMYWLVDHGVAPLRTPNSSPQHTTQFIFPSDALFRRSASLLGESL